MLLLGGLNAGGMKDLSSEIGKLGGFLEVETTYGRGRIDDTRVVVMHSVDIRPDLDLLSVDSCSDERRCIVASSTL